MDPERWRRVRDAMQEAVELDPAERSEFLDRACPDPRDRREVESLLSEHDRHPAFLEEGAGALARGLLSPRTSLAPGEQVGSYSIQREIGRGGMGVVYLATDLKLGREVAIKVVPDALAHDERRRERLRREARAAAAVSHPGIAQVYALEEDAGGPGFVVSEYVDGRTLRDEIAAGPLPVARAIDTARQVARALAAAHGRGVVHRDLKPENVMRARDGTVKVLDFGLAQLDEDAGNTRLTRAGTLLGTPGYMAPEQLRGEEASPASDIYAVGLLLHEMLTGQHAFAGSSNSATALMARILDGAPNALPSEVARQQPGLSDLLARILAKRPDERVLSMASLALALERLGQPAAGGVASWSTPATEAPTATGWWQLHQIVITAIYGAMIYPAWLNRGTPLPAWAHSGIVLAVVLAAAVAITLRLHLVFVARVHPARLGLARRRSASSKRAADLLMAIALLTAAGAALVRDRVWFAALFFTVAAALSIAALLIESATAEATFGEDG